MPTYTGYGEIDYFNIIERLGDFITNNVSDIRTDRTNSRWVFPTFPDSDSNYPEVVIKLNGIKYDENSAGRFLSQETDISTGNVKHYYSLAGTADVRIYVLTEKRSQYTVNRNGSTMYLRNQIVNEFIANSIRDMIKWKRYDFMDDDYIVDVRISSISEVFDDSPSTWACELSTEIEIRDIWVEEYDSTGELIDTYSLTMSVS